MPCGAKCCDGQHPDRAAAGDEDAVAGLHAGAGDAVQRDGERLGERSRAL